MVKNDAGHDRAPRGFARHLEGWQPGLLAVVLAGSVALLAVPKSVAPVELPVSRVDATHLRRIAAADDDDARSVLQTPLDADVRALGSLLRAFGKADAERDDAMLVQLRMQITPAVTRARALGEGPLLALRAFQLQSFLREVHRFVATGQTSAELVELGGPFADVLVRNGWCTGPAPCVMRMDEHVLRAAFKRRWNEVSGISGGPFDLSGDELRAFYGFLLQHPPDRTQQKMGAAEAAFLLRKVDEICGVDASYPREFARGIVHYQAGDYRRAAEFFSAHLETYPDGPWTLRAQNHLRAALERSVHESP